LGPEAVSLPGANNNNGLAVGDVNGDGIPDLVSKYGYVAYGEGNGAFTKPASYPVESDYEVSNVVLADLVKNGLADIVVGGNEAVSVLLDVSKGFLEDGIWTNVTGGGGCGAAADFNGDGKPDLAVDNANGISILLGTGKYLTPFNAGTNIALEGAACLVTGDINNDGIPDLLVPVNGTTPVVNAYLGNGDGTFMLKSTIPMPSGGYLVLGDFNHDGKLDFATSGNLIALGDGDGTFQAPTHIVASPPSSGFSGIAVGDINNDGWPDLVLTNNGIPYNNLFVLLNNQKGGFTQVASTVGALTSQPILVDLNGDGNLDLVLLASSSGGAAIYLGNRTGVFTYQNILTGPIVDTPGLITVADINGDGIPDIGVLAVDTLEIYLGEGGAAYATPFSIGTGPSPGSILIEDLHGQSTSSGIPDIVEPDTSGGVLVLFNPTP
jgi:FG-GAP-like repeat